MARPISPTPHAGAGPHAQPTSPVGKRGAQTPTPSAATPSRAKDEDAFLTPARAPNPQAATARRNFGSWPVLTSFQCMLLTGWVALMLQVVPTLANGGGHGGGGGGHGGHGGMGGHGHGGHGHMGGHHHGGGYTGNTFTTFFSIMFAWMMCRRRPRE